MSVQVRRGSRFATTCRDCGELITLAREATSGRYLAFAVDPVPVRCVEQQGTGAVLDELNDADRHRCLKRQEGTQGWLV